MIDFLPPVLMGEARQQQQVVLCWDTRTTQPCTPLVTGVVWKGVCVCVGGMISRSQTLFHSKSHIAELPLMVGLIWMYKIWTHLCSP